MIFDTLIRPRYFGDEEKAKTKLGLAKKMIQLILNAAQFQDLKQDVFRRIYDQGDTQIKATLSFNCILLDIWCKPTAKKRERKEVEIITRPIVLVAVGRYHHPTVADHESLNAYHEYYTYPQKVILYDVIDDAVILNRIDGVLKQSMTTTQLKELHGINVWHIDEFGNLTDKGLRIPDDPTHEKSFPLSRYLNRTSGFLDQVYTFAHGAHALPAVAWTADALVEPAEPVINPPPPWTCFGSCVWDQSYWEGTTFDAKTVDTKGTGIDAINRYDVKKYKHQHDLVLKNAVLWKGPLCTCIVGTSCVKHVDPMAITSAFWKCRISTIGPKIQTLRNYPRFGGSYRLTTRDTYPSTGEGCIGYIQTTFKDYQEQCSDILAGISTGGVPPCPTHDYLYIRNLNAVTRCSFGDIYSTSFSHGTYDYWTCDHAGTQGVAGDDFEYPGTQQAFMGIEAGIIDSKVISVTTIVAGTERMAWPYIGDWATPGKWDSSAAHLQPKDQGIKAGINITELDKELDYVDMIMSANDIDYFSLETGLPISWDGEEIDELEEDEMCNFEIAVTELVEEYYGGDDTFIDSTICLESRVIEQYVEKNIETGIERIIGYGSCKQPNPWLTPKIGRPFWRPL